MRDKRKQVLDLTKKEKRIICIALEHLIDDCTKANEQITRPEDKVDLTPMHSLLQKFKKNVDAEETINSAGDTRPEFPWRIKP